MRVEGSFAWVGGYLGEILAGAGAAALLVTASGVIAGRAPRCRLPVLTLALLPFFYALNPLADHAGQGRYALFAVPMAAPLIGVVLLRTRVLDVEGQSGHEVRVLIAGPDGDGTVTGTDLLIAAGRTPNTAGIGLAEAGVELDAAGYVKVDEHLATTADGVWAMGECAGSPKFTHVAFDDFRVVRDNLHGASRTTAGRLVPFCLFTDPELARVGCNETEARRRGIRYRLLTLPMAAVLRTRTLSEPRGFLKMVLAADSDEILGFTAFGAEASELMAAVQVAMIGQMPYTTLRTAIFTHPTAAEGLTFLLSGTPTTVPGR